MNIFRINYSSFIIVFLCIFVLSNTTSCARKGRPNGGPKDITPPVLLKASPDTFSTHIPTDIKKIELDFDEYVVLKDYMKNVLVSPPIEPSPIFSPSGVASKTVKVEFSEKLNPETTYTINFGQSIQDNNEGNPYPYFTYVFSTGDKIDSLQLNGKIVNLGEKEMPKNVVAALYKVDSAYTDSLIYTQKPYYVAKIDSANQFNLNYLHKGEYKLVAFNDETPNMKYDPKTEKIAFHPEIVAAGDSGNFELNLFQPNLPYRAVEASQTDFGKLEFYFEGKPENVKIIPLSHTFSTQKIQHKPYSDTLTYYFNPTAKGDTLTDKKTRLKFAVEHLGVRDTIPPVLYDNEKLTKLNVYGRKLNYVPGMQYQIEANYPLDTLDKAFISVQKDTLDIDFEVERLKENRFALNFPIAFDTRYKIALLPNAIKDYMQRTNDSLNLNFSVQNVKEYGNLILKLQNTPEQPFWLKLFDKQDKELQSIYGQNSEFSFTALKPNEYYFKLIVDENANSRYDTGNLFEGVQPEKIYVYPTNISVKAYWDIQETWVLGSDTTPNETESSEPKRKTREELETTKPKILK